MGGTNRIRPAIGPLSGALCVCIALSFASSNAFAQATAANPCEGVVAEIRVDTSSHRLRLCEVGKTAHEYPIALGRGGVGKQQEGDRKTPLGRYRLSDPRSSKSFGIFVLLGYPTTEQHNTGLTGGDVGIHGPPRSVLGSERGMRTDWTDGCIALDTDAEIAAIASWIERTKARWIEVR